MAGKSTTATPKNLTATPKKWTPGETVIALDVYMNNRNALPTSPESPMIKDLSETLRSLAVSSGEVITDTFRNSAGCFMKLRQFQNIDEPPKGLKNHSKTDREIFSRYAKDPVGRQIAVALAKSGKNVPDESLPEDLAKEYTATQLSATSEKVLQTAHEPQVRGDVIVQPGVKPVGQLIKNETRLAIPRYQRAFSWNEAQVVDLCDDIRRLAVPFSQGKDEAQHFFGGLVMTQNPQGLGGWDVIDGQQRLTTFFLVLLKLADAYDVLSQRAEIQGDTVTQQGAVSNSLQIRREFLWVDEANALTGKKVIRPRLIAPEEDHEFFTQLLKGDPPPPGRASQHLLIEATEIIWRELFAAVFTDVHASEAARHKALLTIQTAMLSGSIVVQLTAQDTKAAYRLFMVLNDRGTPLSEGDLLRADTLEALANLDEYFDRGAAAWDSVLKFDADTVKRFLRQFYPSVYGHRVSIHNLVEEYQDNYLYKDLHREHLSAKEAETLVTRIEQMADEVPTFEDLLKEKWPYTTDEVSHAERLRLTRLLRTLKHELALPLLLAGARTMSQKDFAQMLFTIERFAFRYKNVCNGHADSAGRVYNQQAKYLRKHPKQKWPFSGFIAELKKLIDSDADEATFRSRIDKQLRYDRQGQRNNIKWILGALEDCHSWLHEDPKKRPNYPTLDTAMSLELDPAHIDHIYPQNPKSPDVEASLEPVKHYLGNLTLLEGKHNIIGGNTPFSRKRDIYKNMNRIQETKSLARNHTWTKQKVAARQDRIVESAVQLCCF